MGDLQGHPFHGNQYTEFFRAGDTVSGLKVRSDVPNMSSVGSSIERPEILPGVREVPLSAFRGDISATKTFYDPADIRRVNSLADQIRESKEISPLIVGVNKHGRNPYVIEGSHRVSALHALGVKSLPAIVVKDLDDEDDG